MCLSVQSTNCQCLTPSPSSLFMFLTRSPTSRSSVAQISWGSDSQVNVLVLCERAHTHTHETLQQYAFLHEPFGLKCADCLCLCRRLSCYPTAQTCLRWQEWCRRTGSCWSRPCWRWEDRITQLHITPRKHFIISPNTLLCNRTSNFSSFTCSN